MRRWAVVAGMASLAMAIGACSSGSTSGGAASRAVGNGASSQDGNSGNGPKVAMLLTGAINDNDWNYVAYHALQQVKAKFNADTAYNESVAAADATQNARQLVANGYKIIAFDSPAFLNSAEQLAKTNSDVTVIGQDATGALPDQPKNMWVMQVKYYPGEYVLGYAAGLVAQGPKACYISGLKLPNIVGAANAAFAGMKTANSSIGIAYTFTGDFDDATKARQAAAAMINDGCGSFIVHLNGAVTGVVQAIKDSGKSIPWFGLNTDKHDMDTANYAGGYAFDFDKAYTSVIGKITEGTRTGAYDLAEPFKMLPLYNVTDEQKAKITKVFDDVTSGTTKVSDVEDGIHVPS